MSVRPSTEATADGGTPVQSSAEDLVPDVASVPLRLSVFDDRTPLGPVAAGALGDTPLVHPGEGGLAATVQNHQVFLVEAAVDRVCIVVVREAYGSAGTGCHPIADLLTGGVIMWTNFSFDGSGPGLLLLAVPDGYTQAAPGGHRTSIANNLAVVPPVPHDRTAESRDGGGSRSGAHCHGGVYGRRAGTRAAAAGRLGHDRGGRPR